MDLFEIRTVRDMIAHLEKCDPDKLLVVQEVSVDAETYNSEVKMMVQVGALEPVERMRCGHCNDEILYEELHGLTFTFTVTGPPIPEGTACVECGKTEQEGYLLLEAGMTCAGCAHPLHVGNCSDCGQVLRKGDGFVMDGVTPLTCNPCMGRKYQSPYDMPVITGGGDSERVRIFKEANDDAVKRMAAGMTFAEWLDKQTPYVREMITGITEQSFEKRCRAVAKTAQAAGVSFQEVAASIDKVRAVTRPECHCDGYALGNHDDDCGWNNWTP